MTIKRFLINLLALFSLFTVSLACKDSEKSLITPSFSINEEYLIQKSGQIEYICPDPNQHIPGVNSMECLL